MDIIYICCGINVLNGKVYNVVEYLREDKCLGRFYTYSYF